MPKSQFIDPKKIRKRSHVKLADIPVNHYRRSFADELKNFSTDEMIGIYRDMAVIREFETMLNLIKTTGEYSGVAYNYPGPAHLSIGQEASAVGQAYVLDIDDFIFGSHRSHGEILAKGLSAIAKNQDDTLLQIMENQFAGETLRVVERNKRDNVKALATDFLVYGALAEIFGRQTGFNRGLGGSMHVF
ncbi:MAG: thiamine pyrophosphate-dependent enzyme, partial [Lentisphaeria bacterium]|nr:thiamine pyrophosphate-dependent enzyme [Lentisphaeria bacterium]